MATVALRSRVPGAASAEVGEIDGRPVVSVEIHGGDRQGALAESDGDTIAAAARMAWQQRVPIVATIASSGADITEGLSALVGWGRAAHDLVRCSGVVPIIVVVTGPAVSGPALLLGLADVVIMTPDAYAFVSGPRMVTEFTGVPITPSELGGTGPHSRSSGVVSLVAADADDARDLAAAVLSLLPTHTDELPPRLDTDDPPDRPTPELAEVVPASATGSYDVRTVARSIVDDGDLLELRATWAANIVTALGTIDGHPVGIVANQPQTLAGTLDISASQKGARFVAWCDAFSVPLLTVVDTPGFSPGKDQEWRGMIRHGAQLAFAYARATVPRVCLTLRKSYGGAYIVMDCKTMGNDLSLAWPSAEIAVMGAKGAAEILQRRATPEERAAAEADYEERLLNPWRAAERGLIDAVIDPADTRREVAAAFQVLRSKREQLRPRAHDNTPL
jgi:acetyl-CoA carboxylase carboxyltransferase component